MGTSPPAKQPFSQGTRCSSFLFPRSGFCSLPACGIAQTSQSHPLLGTRGPLTPLILQSLPPPSLLVHSIPDSALLPWAVMYAANKLLSTSSVQCQVSRVLGIPVILDGNPNLTNGSTGSDCNTMSDKSWSRRNYIPPARGFTSKDPHQDFLFLTWGTWQAFLNLITDSHYPTLANSSHQQNLWCSLVTRCYVRNGI